ncbi:maleylpyruvate isomerase family mycothiol-dependent enzyme [Streptomyces sp. NPDC057617]|uniref:maleylpyruvate isomerase family mycothiol-dependent enzyme n=1 Tax=Streptomyces sp. NPDC057617 TaxID=3346184 RepID=UPI0036B130A2
MRDLVRRQDEHFLEFASSLTDDEWAAPSLCAGWTNKDVLSHLALGLQVRNTRLLTEMARQRGSFDTANDILTRTHTQRHSAAELIGQFDRGHDSPRGIGRLLPSPLLLGDHTVHHLDIALALGRSADLAPEVANAVLHVETTIPNPFVPARTRSRNLHLTATDTGWNTGPAGRPEVSGPADALISVLAGRGHARGRLAGPGLPMLAARL